MGSPLTSIPSTTDAAAVTKEEADTTVQPSINQEEPGARAAIRRIKTAAQGDGAGAAPAVLEPDAPHATSEEDWYSKHHVIAVRAYELWELNGRQEGTADETWFNAERQIEAGEPPLGARNS